MTDDKNPNTSRYKKEIVELKLFSNPSQNYIGESLNNNLHGHGFYMIEKENEKLFYDGLFYANKLEGYSQIFYQDGSNFHGLFKSNKRFGPGIFTYSTGEQDVGLWDGFSIIRLGTTVCHSFIPKLAQSVEGNVKILKYRNSVPICVNEINIAEEVLKTLGANEKVMRDAHKLYNMNVKNKNNIFFNKKLYDENFFNKQDCCIDILVTDASQDEETPEIENENRNDLEIVSVRLEKLGEHIEKLNSLLRGIESNKTIVLHKMNYCRNCCNILEAPQPCEKPDEVMDIKVPEQEINNVEEKSLALSINYDDLNFVTPVLSIEEIKVPEIEKYLQSICVCQEAIEIEDLHELEKQLDGLLAEETFYGNIRNNMMTKFKQLTILLEKTSKVKTKKVVVDELLAWNNERLLMDMLKHSFLHRESEKLTTFKVSAILGGRRTEFAHPGVHEKVCTDFLTTCSLGGVFEVLQYLRRQNMNVNVSDSAGNTGLFYATAKNRNDVIQILVNFGANLSQMNDEGLTSLNLCILCYISQKNNIEDWETSLLPVSHLLPDEQTGVIKWHLSESFCGPEPRAYSSDTQRKMESRRVNLEKKSTFEDTKTDPFYSIKYTKYFFDTTYRAYPVEVNPDTIETKSEAFSSCSIGPHEFRETDLKSVESTIITLLECGANPNIGEVPFPPLIMSIFSENSKIVKKLLEADANINVVFSEENLTCLHIIATAKCTEENVNICSILSEYSCNPNAKTNINHWPEQKVRILGNIANIEKIEDKGKNPLHILCLRQDFDTDQCDFFKTVCQSLIKSGIDVEDAYLGLNGLSLAILSGNLKLVENLLVSDLIDPYKISDSLEGNVLTLFFSERFKDVLPAKQCIEMLDFLVNFGVNPLHHVGEFENAIAFIDGGSDGNKKDKKTSHQNKNDSRIILKNHLRDLARKMIIENIRMQAVGNLYNLAYMNMLDHASVKVLAEYLTPEKAIENLKLLFNYGKINIEQLDEEVCLELLDYIEKNKIELKQNKKKKKLPAKIHDSEINQTNKEDYKIVIGNMNFQETPKSYNLNLLRPGLDDPTRYDVCFECLQGRNKILNPCTRCQLIYFCSSQCNKLNLKKKSNDHVCRLNLFAKKNDGALSTIESERLKCEDEDLLLLCKLAHDKSNLMMWEKKQTALEILRKKEEEERKLDIYGTKYLHRKKCVVENSSKLKGAIIDIDNSLRRGKTLRSLSTELNRMSSQLDEKLRRLSSLGKHSMSQIDERKHPDVFDGKNKKTQTYKISKKKIESGCLPPKCKYDIVEKSTSKTPMAIVSKFEPLPNLEEPYLIIKKTKKIPSEAKHFMEILRKFFPNLDLSYLLLPYTCYSNGHLYYQFMEDDYFYKNYSTI